MLDNLCDHLLEKPKFCPDEMGLGYVQSSRAPGQHLLPRNSQRRPFDRKRQNRRPVYISYKSPSYGHPIYCISTSLGATNRLASGEQDGHRSTFRRSKPSNSIAINGIHYSCNFV
ncbi:hypothetical protein N7455_011485 [Penicillium solitum]|uniref:uncharacterized protein n=1 Tax=Penicillium solitum TaxID=60172 RepID=UPI0032C4741E|nr:hypothetical protein N7455_011485 [Penicillium solitum]